ncbi:MAG: hypothetical protein PVG21_00215, partial [Gammaproteobacteria bacterium]
ILQSRDQWSVVAERLMTRPEGISPGFQRWAETQRAEALLKLDDSDAALSVLRGLLWADGEQIGDDQLNHWRQLVIRAYLAGQDMGDAETAVQRFRQDYPDQAGDWPELQARIYLHRDQPLAASQVLEKAGIAANQPIRLLADFKSASRTAGEIFKTAIHRAVTKDINDSLRRHYWAVAALAAEGMGNTVARISALEHALALKPLGPQDDGLFAVNANQLWEAYKQYGQQLGNDLQLVVGSDQAWFVAASNRFDTEPVKARALFAVVAMDSFNAEHRAVADWQLASLLNQEKDGGTILEHLYLDSKRFARPEAIPAQVRYILVEHVLDIPDIPLASRLMTGLDTPPPKADPRAWQLRRARVLILGGRYDEGVKALGELFARPDKLVVDRVEQVLFDLQTVGRHEDALRFFGLLLQLDLPDQRRREILYWMGDSCAALKRYTQAAEFYLHSATLTDPFSMDQWAQTARYQAAQALASAGLLADARHIYQGLLGATRDASRQAVLRHKIQELLLLKDERARNARDRSSGGS